MLKLKDKKIGVNILIINLLAFFSVLSPNIYMRGIPSIRMEHVVLFFSLIYLLSKGILKKRLDLNIFIFPILLFVFGFINILSIVNGDLNGYTVVLNDIFELYKIFVYILTFVVVINLITKDDEKIKVLRSLNIYIMISNLISFTQYFNFLNLNVKYIKYVAPGQQKALMPGYTWPRVVGLTNNPNVYAYIVVIGLVLSMGLFLYTKNKFYMVSMVTNFISLLMTRSRTGVIMFVVSFAIIAIFYIIQEIIKGKISVKDKGKWMVGIGAGLVLFLMVFLFILPESLTWRIKELFNLGSSNSWQRRLENWDEYLQYFFKNPFIGTGPVKSIDYQNYPDNEWLLLLKRYGVIGSFYFMFMFLIPIALNWNRLKRSLTGKIFISITIGSFVYMIPAIAYHSFQLMSVLMILAGLGLSNPRENEARMGYEYDLQSKSYMLN